MKVITWLTLGRVSNLPSVWTNIIAAVFVAQASVLGHTNFSEFTVLNLPFSLWLGTFLALSMMYIGGMFLNDAFDAKWDKEHQVPRPIALGEVSANKVWLHGGIMLALGIIAIGSLYQLFHSSGANASYPGWLTGLSLATFILLYNYLHKGFSLSPVLMGLCRFFVYLVAAVLLAELTTELFLVAAGICAYICGVTYSAKNEHINQVRGYWSLLLLFLPVLLGASIGYSHPFFWLYASAFTFYIIVNIRKHLLGETRSVGGFIGGLLAGIPLLDGLALASMNLILPSLVCLAVFLVMPRLQRWISAT